MPTKVYARSVRVCAAILTLVLVGWRPATAQLVEVKAGISDPVSTVLAGTWPAMPVSTPLRASRSTSST